MDKPCLCGSKKLFSACCQSYVSGQSTAPTAEALMRSRYSAFCQGNIDYLLDTHQTRISDDRASARASLRQSVNSTEWVNLLVVSTKKGKPNDKTGVVEFVAAYRPKRLSIMQSLPGMGLSDKGPSNKRADDLTQLHEKSRFIKEGDRWFYTDGDILPPYQPKRAQPCWCGSGQKFKQCHG